ncbi:MAG: gliding motility-associated C-terminal domain-containing protein [Elusimicrobia bacterium]|nr:gliding motility-associated C-terminal domain-containing protein [Elusimicrobiota bacterium]
MKKSNRFKVQGSRFKRKDNFFRIFVFLFLTGNWELGTRNFLFAAAPDPPANLRMNPSVYDHWAHLIWDASLSSGVVKYKVYRTTVAGFAQDVVQVATSTALNYLDLNLDNGVVYYYRAVSVNGADEESLPSISTQIWTHPIAPTPGGGFRVAEVTTASIYWVWTPGTAPEGAQRLINVVTGDWVGPELGVSTAAYAETLLTPGVSVASRAVVTYNITGRASSNPDGMATLANPVVSLGFTFVGSSVAVAWGANGNGSSAQYLVQKSLDGVSYFQADLTTKTSLTDGAVAEGSTVYYRIRSQNDRGVGASFSVPISTAIGRVPPAAISDLTAVPGANEGSVLLSWTATGEDGYLGDFQPPAQFTIHRSTASDMNPASLNEISITTSTGQGSRNGVVFEGLNPGTTFYFRVFTMDNDKNLSAASNLAFSWSQWDTVAPSRITNLTVNLRGDTTAFLEWSSPGDNGRGGAFNGIFEVGYSSNPIDTDERFDALAQIVRFSTTTNPREYYSCTISTLVSESRLYFAVRAYDDRFNRSPISNLFVVPLDNVPPPDVAGFLIERDTGTDNLNRLSWSVPGSDDIARLLVIRSSPTAPSRSLLKKGIPLGKGSKLADGSIVISTITAAVGSLVRYEDLIPGVGSLYTTFYYLIVSSDAVGNYSSGTLSSVSLRENIPPREPYGVLAEKISRDFILISWLPPKFNGDGSLIAASSVPRPHEVSAIEIYNATAPAGPWNLWKTTSPTESSLIVRTSGLEYFRLQAIDVYGNRSPGASMIVDSSATVTETVLGGRSYVSLAPSLASYLRPSGNPLGQALRLRSQEINEEERGITYTAVRFWAEIVESGQEAKGLVFPRSEAKVVLHYAGNERGEVSAASALSRDIAGAPLVQEGTVRLENADRELGLYWHNGQGRIKVYGDVDKTDQTISLETASLGGYYVQKLYREAAFDFDVTQVEPRVLTPNGDGRNDVVIFRFNNPKDSSITGRIFDLSGSRVADLTAGPVTDSKMWDGRDFQGAYAGSGVYIYQLEAEGQIFNGTLAVAR